MNDRIQFVIYQRKNILLVDLSHCSATEVEKTVRAVPDFVTAQPRGSVLMLSDFTRASFDEEALRAMKETAVFDKPYVKRTAWVGAEAFPRGFVEKQKSFCRREFPAFETREEALTWLAQD